MADTVDGLESLGHINTAAAETVELDTSREDVRVLLEGSIDSLAEGALESKSTLHLVLALVLVGLAGSIITAHTRAVIGRAMTDARGVAVARLVASLTDAHVKELVGKRLLDNLADEGVNAELDLALSLEGGVVGSRGLALVVVLGEGVRDEVLRNSGIILLSNDLALDARGILVVLHEAEESKILEAEVTILAGSSGGLGGSIVVGILKDGAEVGVHAVSVDGADPAMRPARGDIGAELGILKASIGRGRGRSRGGDVDVLGEVLLVPHGARVASGHEEDESLEHLLGGHGIEDGLKIVVVEKLVSGHGDDTSVAVIIVEDEDVILLGGLENLAAAAGGGIARENIDEILDGSLLSDVILHNALINIDVFATLDVELVVDLAGEGILGVVSDIILEEGDDAVVRDASLVGKLVCLVHRGLVTIVAPASATGNENNPGVAAVGLTGLDSLLEKLVLLVGKSHGNKSECDKESLHVFYQPKKTQKKLHFKSHFTKLD